MPDAVADQVSALTIQGYHALTEWLTCRRELLAQPTDRRRISLRTASERLLLALDQVSAVVEEETQQRTTLPAREPDAKGGG